MTADLFPRFSDAEYERRHRAVRAAMSAEGVDALVIGGGRDAPEIHYLTNYRSQAPCWLIFPRDGKTTCLVHFYNHVPCAKEQSLVEDIRWYGPSGVESVAEELKRRGLDRAKIGIVSLRSISYGDFTRLQRLLPQVKFKELGPQLTRIRLVRSREEIDYLRRSGYLTDLACEALEERLRPGMSEHDVLAVIYGSYIKHGGEPGVHFIAATNMNEPDRFVPWQRPSSRVLEAGSVLITELTVGYAGYTTQIHRPFAVGREPSPLYRRLFDVALECYERLRRLCKPGTTSEEIVAATSVIEENGFTSYDSVFHGERGKGPELGSRSAAHPFEPWTLAENMVHVIQPNPVTRDLKAGLQLGAAVLVTPAGGEPLHNYPFKFPVCGLS